MKYGLTLRCHSERSEESRSGLGFAVYLAQSQIPRGVHPEHPERDSFNFVQDRLFASLRMTAKGSE